MAYRMMYHRKIGDSIVELGFGRPKDAELAEFERGWQASTVSQPRGSPGLAGGSRFQHQHGGRFGEAAGSYHVTSGHGGGAGRFSGGGGAPGPTPGGYPPALGTSYSPGPVHPATSPIMHVSHGYPAPGALHGYPPQHGGRFVAGSPVMSPTQGWGAYPVPVPGATGDAPRSSPAAYAHPPAHQGSGHWQPHPRGPGIAYPGGSPPPPGVTGSPGMPGPFPSTSPIPPPGHGSVATPPLPSAAGFDSRRGPQAPSARSTPPRAFVYPPQGPPPTGTTHHGPPAAVASPVSVRLRVAMVPLSLQSVHCNINILAAP